MASDGLDDAYRYGTEAPPSMAETDECAHLACFLIAEVTVIHSVVIKATGSIVIAISAGGISTAQIPCRRFSR